MASIKPQCATYVPSMSQSGLASPCIGSWQTDSSGLSDILDVYMQTWGDLPDDHPQVQVNGHSNDLLELHRYHQFSYYCWYWIFLTASKQLCYIYYISCATSEIAVIAVVGLILLWFARDHLFQKVKWGSQGSRHPVSPQHMYGHCIWQPQQIQHKSNLASRRL